LRPAAIGALTLLFLAGCSKADQSGAQVAVRVNADEISMSQLASAVSRLPDTPPERQDKARREALDMLVDQQLAAQMALKQGLEHDPEVLDKLDAARREILARAYLRRVVATLPAPTDDEVQHYYDEHPFLYAQRRYYVLREIAMPAKDAPAEALRAMASKISIDQIAAWLRLHGKTYSGSASQRPAEDIPPGVLEVVSRLRRGDTGVAATADGVFVVHLVETRDAPLEVGVATPRIRRLIAEDRARNAVTRDIAQIKERSSIEYRNVFAEAGSHGSGNWPVPGGARGQALLVDDLPAAH
jgi:EpsD family peptidyl-prolyl cis-trans isomerase